MSVDLHNRESETQLVRGSARKPISTSPQTTKSSNATSSRLSLLNECSGGDAHDPNRTSSTATLLSTPDSSNNVPSNPSSGGFPSTKVKTSKTLRHFGWWWEVTAIVVSLTSTAVIISTLLYMNGKPLRDWRLPIQLNSLIAICSTLARSAILLALTECLSQLKWNHFERRGGATLDHLQLFDAASRGPWGSLVFFSKLHRLRPNILAMLGAVLTLLALAFEPFTQQIIDFPSRRAALVDGVAYASSALAFETSKDMLKNSKEGPKLMLMREMITMLPDTNGSLNSHLVCHGDDCVIPEHWSLAACDHCEEAIKYNDQNVDCSYTYDDDLYLSSDLNLTEFKNTVIRRNGTGYSNSLALCTGIPALLPYGGFDNHDWQFMAGGIPRREFHVDQPYAFGFQGENRLEYDYVEPDKYKTDAMIGVLGLIESSSFPPLASLDAWEGVELTKKRCRITYCGKRTSGIKMEGGSIQTTEEVVPLTFSRGCEDCSYSDATVIQAEGAPKFQVNTDTRIDFGDQFAEVANGVLIMQVTWKYILDSTTQDITNMLKTIINSFLRSDHNLNVTRTYGSAFGQETYVHVRWEWIVLPCFILGASVWLLIATIHSSRRDELLYKTSLLVGYFHGLEGWPSEELEEKEAKFEEMRETRRMNASQVLENAGRQMRVRLQRNEMGNVRFTRETSD